MINKDNKNEYGFTLIELLVVIAILSLLVSILMPSLQKAKQLAKRVVCSANLRGIITNVFLYASENDDTGPGVGNANKYILDSRKINAPFSQIHADLIGLSEGNDKLFHCPSDEKIYHNSQLLGVDWGTSYSHCIGDWFGTAYVTPKWSPNIIPIEGKENPQFSIPSQHPFCADAYWEFRSISLMTHTGGYNVSFLDGHIGWYELNPIYIGRYRNDW